MATNYSAWFNYKFSNSAGVKKDLTVPIVRLKVDGGADRIIDIQSTSDISLTSELEQARSFKNLILGMPPSNNGDDMRAALDLTEAATGKTSLFVSFYLYKFTNGKSTEGFRLMSWEATIKKPPQIVQTLLKIEIKLDGRIDVERIMYNQGKKPKSFPF